MSQYMNQIGINAINASRELLGLDTKIKNQVLNSLADKLVENSLLIIEANKLDLKLGRESGLTDAFLDRLMLNEERIIGMSNSLREIANFNDPIGEIISGWKHENGMLIEQKRVPIGVIGVIYESRPNVTIDAAGLAIKTSNAIILRGSEQALNSNKCLMNLVNQIGTKYGLPENSVQLIEFEEVSYIKELIQMNEVVDVVIPRGGPSLKSFVKEHASVPIIFAGAGICHVYVDEFANVDDAIKIISNSKTQRPSTCNSIETVLINKEVGHILDSLTTELLNLNVELRYCSEAYELVNNSKVILANDDDFGFEFSNLILSLKIVDDVEEAIKFINNHSSKHSDTIITNSLENAELFLNNVDSACVYLNSSTRFSDGNEFGFGGEIGISTQKLHARGPMGIRELTTTKYIIRGSGQIRGE